MRALRLEAMVPTTQAGLSTIAPSQTCFARAIAQRIAPACQPWLSGRSNRSAPTPRPFGRHGASTNNPFIRTSPLEGPAPVQPRLRTRSIATSSGTRRTPGVAGGNAEAGARIADDRWTKIPWSLWRRSVSDAAPAVPEPIVAQALRHPPCAARHEARSAWPRHTLITTSRSELPAIDAPESSVCRAARCLGSPETTTGALLVSRRASSGSRRAPGVGNPRMDPSALDAVKPERPLTAAK